MFYEYHCDMTYLKENPSVIETKIKPTLSPLNSRKRKFKGQNEITTSNPFFITSKPKSLDIDQYLKVSPIVQKRRQSSKSLLDRQLSRDSPDVSAEYLSLPHIKVDGALPSLKLQKSSRLLKKKSYSKTSLRHDNRLILPPIEIDQFRSVSAIENIKTLSALSDSSKIRQDQLNKERHSNRPIKNSVSSRREKNIFLL